MKPSLVNRQRADRYMEASGLDALISWSPANVRYLTGYSCWLAPLFREFMVTPGGSGELAIRDIAVLPRRGEPMLVLGVLWGLNAVDSWASDVYFAGERETRAPDEPPSVAHELEPLYAKLAAKAWPEQPLDALAEALSARRLATARLGVELEGASPADLEGLRRRLPHAEVLDATNLLRLVRAVKTDGEIAELERAATIAEAAAAAVFSRLRAGVSVGQAAQDFRGRVANDGADFDHFAVSVRGLGFASGGPVALERGDAMYVDFGCTRGGWFSDSGTTLSVGEPSSTTVEQFEAVRDCVAAGAAGLRPGVAASSVQAAMLATLIERGITESFPHGHGLGVEVRDYPLIMADNGGVIADDCVDVSSDLILEENMVINLEAPLLTPGVRSVHCEQTFVVTAGGCRPLIAQDREAPVVCAAGERPA